MLRFILIALIALFCTLPANAQFSLDRLLNASKASGADVQICGYDKETAVYEDLTKQPGFSALAALDKSQVYRWWGDAEYRRKTEMSLSIARAAAR